MRLHSTAQAQLALDRVTIDIPSKESNDRIYLTWQPVKSRASCKSSSGKPTDIVLRNAKTGGGTIVLGESRGKTKNYKLNLTLPADGTPVDFWIGGASASSDDLDAVLQVAGNSGKIALATIPMMVRIRKDAINLTMKERFRFLRALAKMNADSSGVYRTMREIHRSGMETEAHHVPAFLPWHRAYLLDFERELQAIDPSVTLPYWRFDKPATVLFYKFFMGTSPGEDGVHAGFDPRNPLAVWSPFENGAQGKALSGIERSPMSWNSFTEAAPVDADPPITQTGPATFDQFREMESNPHDFAHGRWIGFLSLPATAPLDPLFFLLHANVDRLWAVWQSKGRLTRTDKSHDDAYTSVQHSDEAIAPRLGHHRNDAMWPWNEQVGTSATPWPPFNSAGKMRASKITPHPPASPLVGDMIDYQGIHSGEHHGFDYDEVKYPKDP